jgi:hypothetical protein
MHGSNCQRAGSGPVVTLVVFSEVQGENAASARCQSSSIGDATPAQKARQARRSAAMLVRIPTGPVRNPADGQKSIRFGERAVRVGGRDVSGTLGGEVTAQNRAPGTTPRLRVGDHDAPGEPCGFGRAGNVWNIVLGL